MIAARLTWAWVVVCGCAVPLAMPRTGTVLKPTEARMSAFVVTGIAPTTARVTTPMEGAPPSTETIHGISPAAVQLSTEAAQIIGALLFSPELQLSYGLFDHCETNVSLSIARAGIEARCGTSRGSRAPVQLALSAAIGTRVIGPVPGDWWRAGVDASFGAGQVVALLNVYFGYLPWRRGVTFFNEDALEWTAYGSRSQDRGEYRLSVPLGVAVQRASHVGERSTTLVIALVPEITLWSHTLSPAALPSDPQIHVLQGFAIFLVMSGAFTFQTEATDR